MSITGTPGAGFPVVPFFTVPCTVPACATFAMGPTAQSKIAAENIVVSLRTTRFIADLALLWRDEARAAAGALAIP